MRHELVISSLAGIDSVARQFIGEIGDRRLIALHAPMGAGKTTFTTALCRVLGVEEDAVGSPTFAIVNEYRTGEGTPMYHFDFYRLDSPEEALAIGLYDYLDSGYLCIMEWPENVAELLPDDTLDVYIIVSPDDSRIIFWND